MLFYFAIPMCIMHSISSRSGQISIFCSGIESSLVKLTKEAFEEQTTGKSLFVKFFAPWCSCSQDLAPEWEQLGKEFKTNTIGTYSSSLIAKVDCCTEDERWWCFQLGITGFPTLLYGNPSHGGVFLEEYKSLARSFNKNLMAFVHGACDLAKAQFQSWKYQSL